MGRILITWFDLMQIHMKALSIWASKQNVIHIMPECLKKTYQEIEFTVQSYLQKCRAHVNISQQFFQIISITIQNLFIYLSFI